MFTLTLREHAVRFRPLGRLAKGGPFHLWEPLWEAPASKEIPSIYQHIF